ncbi:E3 ubiquitin-protein ligase TRAIP-like [Pectinophora gossypiella]|uniref:E3 ubiquitin-protein ligase TRAIP-like n=1 Tax=Pectinophora gossypiella TaxID=13191 RepID=UPI00214F4722|nr:E3 ubiquitin-protein ligase TRAIP-like [Pectinophora gossypiella]
MLVLCTICSEVLNQADVIHVTKCGHLFHENCLSTWTARSNTCPQCRDKVTPKSVFRVYPASSNQPISGDESIANLQSKLDSTILQVRQQTIQLKSKEQQITELTNKVKENEESHKKVQNQLLNSYAVVDALKGKLEYFKAENKEVQKLKEENEMFKKNLQLLQGLQKVYNSTVEEVDNMLEGYTDVRTVATFAVALKKALYETESKKTDLQNRLQTAKQEISHEKKRNVELQAKCLQLETEIRDRKECEVVIEPRASTSTDCGMDEEIFHHRIKDVDKSLNTMVKNIEHADSPYLNLKQSNLALATLRMKPSEYAMLKTAKHDPKMSQRSNGGLGIIIPPEKPKMETKSILDISYDGLGGHSKLDSFPVSIGDWKSKSIPKLTHKHKLKRPNPTGNHNIGEMFKKARNT